MTRDLTCIICPRGCSMKIELGEDKKSILSVSGNLCPRGKKYAESECINPMRTLTTTVKCTDGSVVAVRSEGAIPKDKLFEAMAKVNSLRITPSRSSAPTLTQASL